MHKQNAKIAQSAPSAALHSRKRLYLTFTDFNTDKICACTHSPDQPQPKAQSRAALHGAMVNRSAQRAVPLPISRSAASAAKAASARI